MSEREQYLNLLIRNAKGGDADALAQLSSIALGGNEIARAAILQIDKAHTRVLKNSPASETGSVVWPKEVQEGERGPRLGDVALHNDL